MAETKESGNGFSPWRTWSPSSPSSSFSPTQRSSSADATGTHESQRSRDVATATATSISQRPQTPPVPQAQAHAHAHAHAPPPSHRQTTPPAASPRHYRAHHNAPPSHTSPALASPMSLYRVGIGSPSALSPLRRQFSPSRAPRARLSSSSSGLHIEDAAGGDASDEPDADSIGQDASSYFDDGSHGSDLEEEEEEQDDFTQDSRDVLVERLTDLVLRLSAAERMQDVDVSVLHAKVDEMESVLASHRKARTTRRSSRQSTQLGRPGLPVPRASEERRDGGFWSPLPMPAWLASRFSELSASPLPGGTLGAAGVTALKAPTPSETVGGIGSGTKISSEITDRLVVEAEKLCAELSSVLESLQTRREESDHLHEMLLDRAESAAERILELEKEVAQLEEELSGNESELKHLRLQLRAVEALYKEFVPSELDAELLQSVENWKSDWANLRSQMSHRREDRRRRHGDDEMTMSTITTP